MELSRRSMLKMAGGASLGLGIPRKVLAIFADGTILAETDLVPADKNLSPEWRRSLYERGDKEIWSGPALDAIGMPIGGIAAGQLYLCGDGSLGCWEIFNRHQFIGYGESNYRKRPIGHAVEFGFSVAVGGIEKRLDKSGFSDITFDGRFPTATVRYREEGFPIQAETTAYTPFIPLNAHDSALPATIFEIVLKNVGEAPVKASLDGFLQNVCGQTGETQPGDRKRHTRKRVDRGLTVMTHSVDPATDGLDNPRPNPRPDVPVADFEGEGYGDWKAEGSAFGTGPAQGTLPNQQPVTGFVGHSLVNSYLGGDDSTGTLTSPEFTIQRDFIKFKIGGGNQPGKACINLVVDGRTVRTETGLDTEDLIWAAWNVKELAGRAVRIEIVDQATGGWGHINIDEIVQTDTLPPKEDLDARRVDPNIDTGSLALGVLARAEADERPGYSLDSPFVGHVRPAKIRLRPGQSKTLTFVLGWNFPNHPRGHNYTNFFADAEAVVKYVASNYRRLSAQTKLWRDTYYDSTLPFWLLDRLHMTVGNLSTGTTEWWKTGRFWSWEGVMCCSGTCTHVWNYEHSMARLFPEIERNVRDRQDFGEGFDDATGLVGFRSDREYAADGQCGTILKAYREHQTSADDRFLKEHWPKIKMALEFLMKHDGNGDGIIEDAQPNTYDIDFFGANTFIGSLYLAALRAGEEMAKELGEHEFQTRCRDIFDKGAAATMKRLWNGQYFIQEVDESKVKQYQYGPGCLADQLFGQGWAHQVGLGYLYPKENVAQALRSVWKYNWAPDVGDQNRRWPPQRPFAVPGEAGLFTCTWPIGGREKDPVLYRDEVWTGIEYQVAGHMIWEGLLEEGLSICKGVHERYHPLKRNPYNEIECSDHYARAMASWGVYTALMGFTYNGPAGRIGFAPRISPEDFRAAFTTAEGWGTYLQRILKSRLMAALELKQGRLRVSELSFAIPAPESVKVSLGSKVIPAESEARDGQLVVRLSEPVILKAGQRLTIEA